MSPTPQDHQDDLGDLIDRANDQIAVSDARRKTRIHQSSIVGRSVRVLAGLFLMAGSVWAIDVVWRHVAPHSEEKAVRDLTAIVEQARHSIESARADLGALPEQIPNASLAGVVIYDRSGAGYRLVAESGGVIVTLDAGDTTSVQTYVDGQLVTGSR